MWEAVQLEMERRRAYAGKYGISKLDYATVRNPLSGRVICGHCGGVYGRKIWNSTDERLRRIVWRCNMKYVVKGEKGCENRHIDERVLCQAFVSTLNAMIENRDYFLAKWKAEILSEDVLARYKAKQFIKIIDNAELIEEFDMDLFFRIVEKMSVFEGNKIILTLLDGTEIEIEIAGE